MADHDRLAEYRPQQVLVDGVQRCGINVTVELEGLVEGDGKSAIVDVHETTLDISPRAIVVSGGEGIFVADPEPSPYIRVARVISTLSCDQCGQCNEDVTTLEIPDTTLVGLGEESKTIERRVARATLEAADAVSMVAACLRRQREMVL